MRCSRDRYLDAGKNGLELLVELKKLCPKLPVLILTIHPEETFALRALRAGAAGYVTKGKAAREIIAAVRKVVGGRRYVSEELAEKLAAGMSHAPDKLPHEYLSTREFQILSYRQRILKKLGMKTNVGTGNIRLSVLSYRQLTM